MKRDTKRNVVALSCLLAVQVGCTAIIAQIAKFMPTPTQVTASLTDVVLTGGIESNLPPASLGTMAQSFFPGWKAGGDLVAFTFTKKGSFGFYRIDGTVTVDGKPADYLVIGTYSAILDASPAPRKIEITTTTGEKASFSIEPNKARLKVTSINGQTEKVSIDLTKDVEVALGGPALAEGTMIKIQLAVNQVGIKSIYDVCYLRYAPKIVVPAAAFRNLGIAQGTNAVIGFSDSFLAVGVETSQQATGVSGAFPAVPYTSFYSDGMLVSVKGEPVINQGLSSKGTVANMDYEVHKPNAFASRPREQIKKVGLISLSIRGTTFHEYSETSSSSNTLNMGGVSNTTTTTTTTTTTLQFPKQTDETWEALLADLYPALVGVVKTEFGADDLLVDAVTATEGYKSVEPFAKDDQNTTVNFTHSYRQTKVLSAFMPLTDGFGKNSVNERIMNEVGADALLTLTLDLQIQEAKDGKVLMRPMLAFELVGKINGLSTNTKFFSGTIKSSTGVPFKKDIDLGQLQAIVRKADLVSVFGQALKDLKAQETQNGDYLVVWNLQK